MSLEPHRPDSEAFKESTWFSHYLLNWTLTHTQSLESRAEREAQSMDDAGWAVRDIPNHSGGTKDFQS